MASLVPFLGPVAQVFDAWLTRRQIDKWVKFFAQLLVSYWVTWSAVTGAALGHVNTLIAIGSGMVSGSAVVIFLWVRSPLTKNLTLAVDKDALEDIEQGGKPPVLFTGGQKDG